MMPVVRISDAMFADLSTLATWFKAETPSQAIEKVVAEAMEKYGLERDAFDDSASAPAPGLALPTTPTPGLTHTKLLKASVDNKPMENPKWNGVIWALLEVMKRRGMAPEQIVSALNIPARVGRFEENGFSFHPELGLSFQGQSAQNAWKEIQRLAPLFKVDVEVSFEWRKNPKALHPGEKGKLRAGPG